MLEITVANVGVRTDSDGRYCLNDLHKASGGEKRHGPSYWLANQQTKELLAEMGDTGIPVGPICTVNDGVNNGTFVAKELVYAYAMWISPAFHLKVIRAYDALVSRPAHTAIPQSLPEALRLAADLAEKKAQAEAALAIAAPKADALDLIAAGEESITITEAAKMLGIKRDTLTKWMHVNGWVYRLNGAWVAKQAHLQNRDLDYKEGFYPHPDTGEMCCKPYCHIMPKGLTKLAKVFAVKEPA